MDAGSLVNWRGWWAHVRHRGSTREAHVRLVLATRGLALGAFVRRRGPRVNQHVGGGLLPIPYHRHCFLPPQTNTSPPSPRTREEKGTGQSRGGGGHVGRLRASRTFMRRSKPVPPVPPVCQLGEGGEAHPTTPPDAIHASRGAQLPLSGQQALTGWLPKGCWSRLCTTIGRRPHPQTSSPAGRRGPVTFAGPHRPHPFPHPPSAALWWNPFC